MPGLEATHDITVDSDNAMRLTRARNQSENAPKGVRLEVSDEVPSPSYNLYLYNVLELEHEVNQPPAFPRFIIPAKKKGERFAVTKLPTFVKERYERPGTNDYYYKLVDGRKYASQLLNPASFPGTLWKAQLQNWRSNDQFGNNYNALGCFWSLTEPNSDELEVELEQFRLKARKTLESLVQQAEHLFNSKQENMITPLMHFAMDYLHKQAPWHLRSDLMVDCPNCGEPVKEGVAYHRNSFGERCLIDVERCKAIGIFPHADANQVVTRVPIVDRPAPPSSGNTEEDELEKVAAGKAGKEVSKLTQGKRRAG